MEVTIKIQLQPEVLRFLKSVENAIAVQLKEGGYSVPEETTLDTALTKIVKENDGEVLTDTHTPGEVQTAELPAKPTTKPRPSRAKPKAQGFYVPPGAEPEMPPAEKYEHEADREASLDDIRQLIHTLINAGKRDAIKNLLNANGVERVTDLEESKWGNFFTELKSIENG